MASISQDKQIELNFFKQFATEEFEYNMFSMESSMKIVDSCLALVDWKPGAKIIDVGCGTGFFTKLLAQKGFDVTGLDLSPELIEYAKKLNPTIPFMAGDVEKLPFADESLDGVMLSGIVHHLPDPNLCAKEIFRVLKKGGSFVAFDPNRQNPFMYLYRDRSSPFYSSKGVTPNERPLIPSHTRKLFANHGFQTKSGYLSGLAFTYVASAAARMILPIYNFCDKVLSLIPFLRPIYAFVLTAGHKPKN